MTGKEMELSEGLSTSSQATTDPEPTHFDHLIGEAEAEEVQNSIDTTILSQKDFRKSFVGMHGMASAMTGMKSIALPNSHINEETAHEVADTIYETILDIPMLRSMLQPNNKWIGRAFVMVAYAQGMRGAVRAELMARQPVNKPKAEKTANYSDVKEASKPKKKGDEELDPAQVSALIGE